MDNINLTCREKCLLFCMRFKKMIKPRFDVSHLVRCGLIRQNASGERNSIGIQLLEDTYSLTPFELRFRIAQRRARIHRYITPVTVTILTTIAVEVLKWLAKSVLPALCK